MGKKKVTPKAKNTGKTHNSKSNQAQKKTPQTGRTSGGQVRYEVHRVKKAPTQPKITKPAPNQGREKETDVVEVEIKTQRFPFWAKLKIAKNRPTLVIDEDMVRDKQKNNKLVPGFVHRESTHSEELATETIFPNPDTTDSKPMHLKSPRKLPKRLFAPIDRPMKMPEHLQKRYEKNNNKDK